MRAPLTHECPSLVQIGNKTSSSGAAFSTFDTPMDTYLIDIQSAALRDDAGDRAAGLGRWWRACSDDRLVLSTVAARLLDVGYQPDSGSYMDKVEPDDRAAVRAALAGSEGDAEDAVCEFRVRPEGQGLRWLRLQQVEVLDGGQVVAGILLDITAARQAAARERFNFALTQYLIGTGSMDEAVAKVLRLVCEELGWEWGAFWALEQGDGQDDLLRCRYAWHASSTLAAFKRASTSLDLRPGEGLVGEVWVDGEARWIDEASADPLLVRSVAAHACGLRSAYFFPVVFVAADGRLVRPGVLEFFSEQQRQRDAQLPGLAKSISAMIAQAFERMAQQERILVRAQTDGMTGLANRSHFYDQVDALCAQSAPPRPFGVMYVDLDQFKPINDLFGHEAGNVVLIEFARRLRRLAPPGWRIGRLGGDEFALLSTPGTSRRELERVANAVLRAAAQRIVYGEHALHVSASIGISLFPTHGGSTPELLRAADGAMYASKRNGRNLASWCGAGQVALTPDQ